MILIPNAKSRNIDRMGWGEVTTQMPYGERFRKHRRWLEQFLSPQGLQTHRALQEYEAVTFIHDLLKAPDQLRTHVKRCEFNLISSSIVTTPFDDHKQTDMRAP
jgi:hypothetical protein